MRIEQGWWIIAFAATTHVVWGLLLCYSPAPLRTVPLVSLAFVGQYGAAVILGVIALCAILSLWQTPERAGTSFLWLVPQQLLLMLTAMSGIVACIQEQYADLVIRPWAFICADQAYAILVAFFHGGALIERYRLWWQLVLWMRIVGEANARRAQS